MTGPERLRESLHDLADAVHPADLYDGAVRRSRGMIRREATVGTGAALIVLALVAGGLWRIGGPAHTASPAEAPVAAAQALAAEPPAIQLRAGRPQTAALPGKIFYRQRTGVVRFTPADGRLVDMPLAPVAGAPVPPRGPVFDEHGNRLVRAVRAGVTTLSLFTPDGALLAEATEPASLRDFDLLAYTR